MVAKVVLEAAPDLSEKLSTQVFQQAVTDAMTHLSDAYIRSQSGSDTVADTSETGDNKISNDDSSDDDKSDDN